MARHYRELIAWQKAMALVTHIYSITKGFPGDERFGLTSQMRRCAVSIRSNIAEGQARNTTGEFKQFIGIARGSVAELTTQILIAEQLGFLSAPKQTIEMAEEVGRILTGLSQSLRTNH
ncbi:four helix bundle protein [Stieleria sp. TO1_6]|uniref:four helix bundle protein n=1 Tax=Stieleria tagensis TaxID=2956795 RepID=UPI00209B6F38|nr:four helix bundle protein [Stieleria tagensis]MCO8123310.1 four helix bundle protein [Stieleria tagensis]